MRQKIHCCITPAHQNLLEDFFCPSLPSGFDLQVHGLDLAGAGDFLSKEYMECLRQKVSLIRQSLEEADSDIIVWADVDIVFLCKNGNTYLKEWNELLVVNELLYQRECHHLPGVNGGFFICRPTNAVKKYWALIEGLVANRGDWHDQHAANHLLLKAGVTDLDLKWDYLSWDYYARTHGWPPPSTTVLYHANYSIDGDAVAQKKMQLTQAQKYLHGSFFEKVEVTTQVLKERGLHGMTSAMWRRIKK
jgi:hypothetical protein